MLLFSTNMQNTFNSNSVVQKRALYLHNFISLVRYLNFGSVEEFNTYILGFVLDPEGTFFLIN